MALQPCTECGVQISTKATACPSCGAPPEKPKSVKWWLWIPLVLLSAFMLIGVIVGSTPEGKAKAQDRTSIEICWRQQKDPAFDPGTARFIAATCEKMESDFRQKYGVNP